MQALRLLQDESISKPKVLGLALLSYVQAGPRWYFAKLRLMVDHRVEDALPSVSAPALVIRGEDDHIAPRGWAQEVSRLLPAGRYIEVPHRGHETMVTAGEYVARLVDAHARGEAVGIDVHVPAAPEPLSLAARLAWWAADYAYAVCDSWRCSRRRGRRSDAAGPRRPAGGRDRPNCPRSCCCRASTSTGRSCVRSATR
jgi:hypothetical protein